MVYTSSLKSGRTRPTAPKGITMTPSELHYLYTEAIRTMPEFQSEKDFTPLTRDQVEWQARTLALIELQKDILDTAAFKSAMLRSGNSGAVRAAAGMNFFQLLTTAIARVELQMPPGVRGAFVPMGSPFDALRAITEVMRGAEHDLLIVDPYADESVLLQFATAARDGVTVRVLRDAQFRDCGARLGVAKEAWVRQHGGARPLEVRTAPARSLHDRFISQDSAAVFLISQSLKDLAVRSPATIQRADADIAAEKVHAYETIWRAGETM